jgi:glucose-6-phosphate dehydrogenase assembly protein OpcA
MTPAIPLTARMRQVPGDAIEQELDNDWRAANASALASNSHPGSRNSVLSLVVYTHSQDEATTVFNTVEQLAGVHPSRAIVLAAVPDPGGLVIKSYIATHQHETGGMLSYGEEILMIAHGDAARHLPGAVLPLIVSGLPAYLWWTGEPQWRSEQFEAMVDGCDRLIVDSSEMIQPERSLVALNDVVHRKLSSCAVSDFNWTRQAPWRELIAQFFDAPAQHPFLFGVDRLSIEYAAGSENAPINTAAAYLFAGWLGSRLGWHMQGGQYAQGAEGDRQHTLTDATGRTITVEMQPRFGTSLRSWHEIMAQGPERSGIHQPPCVGPGALMSVHLHTIGGGQTATFAVAREPDMQHASTLAQTPLSVMPSQTVHLPSIGEGALLTEQLQMLGHDSIYEEALDLAATLIGPGPRRMLT